VIAEIRSSEPTTLKSQTNNFAFRACVATAGMAIKCQDRCN